MDADIFNFCRVSTIAVGETYGTYCVRNHRGNAQDENRGENEAIVVPYSKHPESDENSRNTTQRRREICNKVTDTHNPPLASLVSRRTVGYALLQNSWSSVSDASKCLNGTQSLRLELSCQHTPERLQLQYIQATDRFRILQGLQ